MEFLESMTGDIIVALCLLSIAEIVYIIEQIGTGTLLISNNYLLGLIWGSDSTVYFFDAHSKNENGNLSSSDTTVQSVYYNAYPLTLYFQVQFRIGQCTVNAKNWRDCQITSKEV